MKRIILLVVCLLLTGSQGFADMTKNGRVPRDWDQAQSGVKLQSANTDYTNNTVVFANVAATGNNVTGNPGGIVLMATDSQGITRSYYLWVDASAASTGQLKMASFPNISAFSSFPWGDWRSSNGFQAGTKVSSQ